MAAMSWSARPRTDGSVGFHALRVLSVTTSEGFNPTTGFWASCKVLETAEFSGSPKNRKPESDTPFLDVASPMPMTLTKLSIRNLPVPALPPAIGECKLVELVVTGCGLKALPAEMAALHSLETLLLGENELDVAGIMPLVRCDFLLEKKSEAEGGGCRAVDLSRNPLLPDDCPTNCNVVYWLSSADAMAAPAKRRRTNAAAPASLGAGLVAYTYADLQTATADFAAARLISEEGAFGPVYRGEVGASNVMAVKVMREDTPLNADAFALEVTTLSACKHPNLLALLGCSTDGPQKCIVYDFKSRGSLRRCLDSADPADALPWRRRMCILLEVSSALEYLHEIAKPPIVHRDVKSPNVLLGASLQASLGDFGLARICPEPTVADKGAASTRIFGTPGYIDPDYANSGKVTLASDVYGFGVVALEVLTGHLAYDESHEPSSLVDAFEEAVEDDEVHTIVDARLQWSAEASAVLAELVKRCTHSRSKRRPTATATFQALSAECKQWACTQLQLAAGGGAISECVVCMDAPVTTALVPCGHLCLCEADAATLGVGGACPLCTAAIERVVRIYPG